MADSRITVHPVTCIRASEKAYLLAYADIEPVWLPKSQIDVLEVCDKGSPTKVSIPEWLVKKTFPFLLESR